MTGWRMASASLLCEELDIKFVIAKTPNYV